MVEEVQADPHPPPPHGQTLRSNRICMILLVKLMNGWVIVAMCADKQVTVLLLTMRSGGEYTYGT